MSTWGKIVGTASVVTGAVGAIALGGAAQRRAVRRFRGLGNDAEVEFDALAADRSYTVAGADGVALHVEEVGPDTAPLTVIFAHGWTLRSGSWHFQRLALADENLRLVFYDQRSHGRSGRAPTGGSTLQAVAGDLAAVLATAAPDGPVLLVGHSMGGMAILGLAAEAPEMFAERVAGFALIGTSARFSTDHRSRPTLLGGNALLRAFTATAARYPRWLERGRPATKEAIWLLTRNFGFADPDVPAHLVDYVDGMISETPIEVIAEFLPGILNHDLTEGLPVLASLPGLILCGDADRMLPLAQSQALAAALPKADLVVVPGTGHNVMLEAPETVNQALRELVQRAGSGVPPSKKAGAPSTPKKKAR